MDNIDIITIDGLDGEPHQHVIIDHGDGEYTSMPKAVYDAQQAAQDAQAAS